MPFLVKGVLENAIFVQGSLENTIFCIWGSRKLAKQPLPILLVLSWRVGYQMYAQGTMSEGGGGSSIPVSRLILAPNPVSRLILARNHVSWLILATNPVSRLRPSPLMSGIQALDEGGRLNLPISHFFANSPCSNFSLGAPTSFSPMLPFPKINIQISLLPFSIHI